ncbi:Uncharacterized protein OBRU01_13802 [Operophtera brumata]|uniref:Uncharacterized protein n=1 Tax=Operophtera brumata TaxID=104452 RepID=A0A0L7L7T1_OPEBR|nr:Uncharacterized protein OBRU01_13802 [Operophtera brumata]
MVGPNNGVRTGRGSLLAACEVPAVHVRAELTAASVQRRGRGAGWRRVARAETRGGACSRGYARAHGRSVCCLG